VCFARVVSNFLKMAGVKGAVLFLAGTKHKPRYIQVSTNKHFHKARNRSLANEFTSEAKC
jgi:2-phospho-L-lactate guanylyltransferase (CobY/MobA/RfbA family)